LHLLQGFGSLFSAKGHYRMNEIDLSVNHQWSLEPLIGFEHPLLIFDAEILLHTWIILAILFVCTLIARFFLMQKKGIGHFISLSYVQFFVDLCNQSLGSFSFGHFCFITTLFTFITFCNVISIIPWLEEPTKDLNTTLALGIIAFVYTQATAIHKFGILAYIKEYFAPFFIMFPLHVVGKLASIMSISFRLFGNIFGGFMISNIYFSTIQTSWIYQIFGLVTGLNMLIILFFSLFEGVLQAFVFTMLSLTYLSIALQGEGH
jgi:F-type H+-transporting ATPase subunit a